MRRKTEVAWAAGLYEGEGSCFVNTVPPRSAQAQASRTLVLALTMTDEDVVLRFQRIVGVGSVLKDPRPRRDRPDHKMAYHWKAYSTNAALVLELLWPYLGERRREQAYAACERTGMARRHRGVTDVRRGQSSMEPFDERGAP